MDHSRSEMRTESRHAAILTHALSKCARLLALRLTLCMSRLAHGIEHSETSVHGERGEPLNEADQVPLFLHAVSPRKHVHHRIRRRVVCSQAPLNSSNRVMCQPTPSTAIKGTVQSILWVYSTATAAHTGRGVANFNARATFDLLCKAARPGVELMRAPDAWYKQYVCAIAHHRFRKEDHNKLSSSLGMILLARRPKSSLSPDSVKATLSQQLFTFDSGKGFRWFQWGAPVDSLPPVPSVLGKRPHFNSGLCAPPAAKATLSCPELQAALMLRYNKRMVG